MSYKYGPLEHEGVRAALRTGAHGPEREPPARHPSLRLLGVPLAQDAQPLAQRHPHDGRDGVLAARAADSRSVAQSGKCSVLVTSGFMASFSCLENYAFTRYSSITQLLRQSPDYITE